MENSEILSEKLKEENSILYKKIEELKTKFDFYDQRDLKNEENKLEMKKIQEDYDLNLLEYKQKFEDYDLKEKNFKETEKILKEKITKKDLEYNSIIAEINFKKENLEKENLNVNPFKNA